MISVPLTDLYIVLYMPFLFSIPKRRMICSQSEDVLDWEFHEKAALVGRNNFFLFGWETGFESHPVYCACIKKQLKS